MPAPMGELGTSAVRVRVPATSANLGPGFDVLGLALAVHNEVEMRLLPEGLQVEVEGEGASELPFDEGNLAYRAAVAGFTSMGWAPPGLGIRVVNRIPLARGMGSSSATIVGSLLAASELARRAKIREIRGLAHRRLLELAVELEGHPDNVVPAAVGGFTICLPGGPGVRYLAFRRRMP
ncbi:MAG: hypothetical protein HYY09_04465, partial [Firmicutes bacterium]|nr:hypothetical protein [Bacillota bacterium]